MQTAALSLPTHGSTIIFDRVPRSSWASAGEAYQVKVTGKGRRATVWLTSVERGSGTNDPAWAYASAAWRVAQ